LSFDCLRVETRIILNLKIQVETLTPSRLVQSKKGALAKHVANTTEPAVPAAACSTSDRVGWFGDRARHQSIISKSDRLDWFQKERK
jgi:hypothetical protein